MERSNGDLVAKAREMTLDAARRPATVAEARAMLGLVARPAGAPAGGVPA
jgi:3-keto-5-aminohexanoate cleavage enzyme